MFAWLGHMMARTWPLWLVGWLLFLLAVWFLAPRWEEVAQDREFSFLPDDVPSRRGEQLFKKAFPEELLASSVVIVVHREEGAEGLSARDRQFITDILKPGLEE